MLGATTQLNVSGLSLCIQGTPLKGFINETLMRFIPVHTGNTDQEEPGTSSSAVYPCAYREHSVTASGVNIDNGLSLCIQGTLFMIWKRVLLKRFIPVHTGNTN